MTRLNLSCRSAHSFCGWRLSAVVFSFDSGSSLPSWSRRRHEPRRHRLNKVFVLQYLGEGEVERAVDPPLAPDAVACFFGHQLPEDHIRFMNLVHRKALEAGNGVFHKGRDVTSF